MPFYMTVDGGGTKLIAILFNERYELVSCGRGKGINPNFDTLDSIAQTMRDCVEECLSGYDGITIETLYICMPGPHELYAETVQSKAQVNNVISLGEGLMSTLAAIQKTTGYMALAGTGSGVCYVNGDRVRHKGGWGGLLGDQGSGFIIGRDGLFAVVQAYENWGPKTRLYDLLMEAWNLDHIHEILPKVYRAKSYRYVIASVAPLVSKAAKEGDRVCVRILERAGEDMAAQMIALIREVGLHGDIFPTGGVWKGCRIMYDVFCDRIYSEYPQANIRLPVFEPVIGGVVRNAMGDRDSLDEETIIHLSNKFSEYLYKTNW